MHNNDSEHLSVGALIALAKLGINLDNNHDVPLHLSGCEICSRNFKSLLGLLQIPQDKVYNNIGQLQPQQVCDESNLTMEKNAALFILFLSKQFPENRSHNLFKHLNDCFFCFQLFAKNWNDYLTTNEMYQRGTLI